MRDAKPLDAGTGRLCASFDPGTAAWLSLGAPHECHGFVDLSALPPFDERHRGNAAATRRQRLEDAAFADGMLPETYRPDGGRIRHWFAWPGAALAALTLLDRDARLDERLSARPRH